MVNGTESPRTISHRKSVDPMELNSIAWASSVLNHHPTPQPPPGTKTCLILPELLTFQVIYQNQSG